MYYLQPKICVLRSFPTTNMTQKNIGSLKTELLLALFLLNICRFVNGTTHQAEYNILKTWRIFCPDDNCDNIPGVREVVTGDPDFMSCVKLCTKARKPSLT